MAYAEAMTTTPLGVTDEMVADQMLGSVADAEDTVQDAWLRWAPTERAVFVLREVFGMSVAEVAGAWTGRRRPSARRRTGRGSTCRPAVPASTPTVASKQQVTERFFAEQVLVVHNPDKLAGPSVTGSGTDLGSGG
jgi:hypothetical protein